MGVQLGGHVPHLGAEIGGHQYGDRPAGAPCYPFDPGLLCGLTDAIGNDLDATVTDFGQRVTDRLQLFAIGIGAGHQFAVLVEVAIEARRGETQRAIAHGLLGDGGHLGNVGGRCVFVAARAHHIVAHGNVGHLRTDVHGVRRIDDVQIFRETLPAPGDAFVQGGAGNIFHRLHDLDQLALSAGMHGRETDATIAHHYRRYAMPATRCELFVPAHLAVIVGVDINEAWCQ